MKKQFRSQAGFTIASVLIVGAIGAFIMMALSRGLTMLNKAERGVAANLDMSDIVYTVRLLIEKQEICAQSGLIGVNLTPLLNADPMPVPVSLHMPGQPPGAAANSALGGSLRKATGASLVSLNSLNFNNQYVAKLRVATKVRGSALTNKNPSTDFNVHVTLDNNGIITQCSSSSTPPGSGGTSTAPRIRKILGNLALLANDTQANVKRFGVNGNPGRFACSTLDTSLGNTINAYSPTGFYNVTNPTWVSNPRFWTATMRCPAGCYAVNGGLNNQASALVTRGFSQGGGVLHDSAPDPNDVSGATWVVSACFYTVHEGDPGAPSSNQIVNDTAYALCQCP